jgi:hypothetical protein
MEDVLDVGARFEARKETDPDADERYSCKFAHDVLAFSATSC